MKLGNIILGGENPASLNISVIGKKGFRLLELCWYAKQADFNVLQSCVFPSTYWQNYTNIKGGMPRIVYSDIPQPSLPPQEMINYFSDFYFIFKTDLDYWCSRLRNFSEPFIRASVTLDAFSPLSFSGVNYTFDPHLVPKLENYLAYSTSHLLSMVYRPFSEWYLSQHSYNSLPRTTAIVMSEFAEKSTSGVAYILNNTAVIVDYYYIDDIDTASHICDNKCFTNSSHLTFNITSQNEEWQGYWRENKRGERLRQALLNFVEILDKEIPLEVEFIFDISDVLFLTQYRPLIENDDELKHIQTNSLPIPIFHTPGHIEGEFVNLMHVKRSPDASRMLVKHLNENNKHPIYLINDRHSSNWDGFSFMWALSQNDPNFSIAVLLGHGEKRYRSHLMTMLSEDPLINFVGQVCSHNLVHQDQVSQLSLNSNGVAIEVRNL